jgi:hypothetical protein
MKFDMAGWFLLGLMFGYALGWLKNLRNEE